MAYTNGPMELCTKVNGDEMCHLALVDMLGPTANLTKADFSMAGDTVPACIHSPMGRHSSVHLRVMLLVDAECVPYPEDAHSTANSRCWPPIFALLLCDAARSLQTNGFTSHGPNRGTLSETHHGEGSPPFGRVGATSRTALRAFPAGRRHQCWSLELLGIFLSSCRSSDSFGVPFFINLYGGPLPNSWHSVS